MNSDISSPSRSLTLSLFSAASMAFGAGILYVIFAQEESFQSFPGRTIGISLLSDIDPHYRTWLFLLGSALLITVTAGVFAISGAQAGSKAKLAASPPGLLILACGAANLAAAALHTDSGLFLQGAALSGWVLALWWLYGDTSQQAEAGFLLRFCVSWQLAILAFWLAGLPANWWLIAPATLVFLAYPQLCKWAPSLEGPLGACLLLAPVALVVAIECSYFIAGQHSSPWPALAIATALTALCWLLYTRKTVSPVALARLAALSVLLTTFILNQYTNQITYRGFDVFHLAEKLLPLQQYASFGSLPFMGYHPGHGLFDVFPHAIYQMLNGGDILESQIWGNGYFMGWVMQTLYIGILYWCLSRLLEPLAAFFLLWLLPVFHILEPYNALLLLPVIHLAMLPGTTNPWRWWCIQWLLTVALGVWRTDFGMIIAAGNLITAAALSWHRQTPRTLIPAITGLLGTLAALGAVVALLPDHPVHDSLLRISKDLMGIQIPAAAYDRYYKEWNHLVTMQYIVLPAVGALAGGYSVARLYRRDDPQQLALHLIIIFVTAVGFALSIRLLHRHSMVEGFTKTNFFYFAPLLALMTFKLHRTVLLPLLAVLIMAAFIATPETAKYSKNAFWGPRQSYPVVTHPTEFPALYSDAPRLERRARKYDVFVAFTEQYLSRGQTFYDFANAPLLYVLADVQVSTFVTETVWHTSESIQDDMLAELQSHYRQGNLPFVVFRQNKRWDYLDNVDNALRSYKVAEFIYKRYKPCVRVSMLDLWVDKRQPCMKGIKQKLQAHRDTLKAIQPLKRDYLQQFINYGHLPYIWANFDTHVDTIARQSSVTMEAPDGNKIGLGIDQATCKATACYLDIQVSSETEQDLTLYFSDNPQLSLTVRPGKHNYRIRVSALWRWHQRVGRENLNLRADQPLIVHRADLVELQP
jgi:hypothetical protein